ncbi:hypothetical protein BANRA_05501 [Klebsiella pneumoniae]|nr:hypothetical protein BANRA_05501 [Klebsiella pneumoniae]
METPHPEPKYFQGYLLFVYSKDASNAYTTVLINPMRDSVLCAVDDHHLIPAHLHG